MTVYANRQDMTGTERTFANAYVPREDIIRYNRSSKIYGVEVGECALVTAKNHAENEITVHFENGRQLTYNPQRLSGVSVYREAKREFAEGDRIQFRSPFTEKRLANGELATIAKIGEEELTVKLDSGREVSFEKEHFRHIDHGYAVTSHSSQGTTVDRVLINADTSESRVLLNDRMGYVAISRAREDAIIYTNSIEELRGALDRRVDKEMAVEAIHASRDYLQQQREANSSDPSVTQEQDGITNELTEGDLNIDRETAYRPEIAQVEEMQFEIA
jgi:ATP-dependent exoDNAse (exonuclease V) alpha subunit